MKKRFVPRVKESKVDASASMYPLTARSYQDFLFCALPGDQVWFADGKAIDVFEMRWLHGTEGCYRLIGQYAESGEPVDMMVDGGAKVTIQGKASHVVRLIGTDALLSARAWSSYAREQTGKTGFVDDNCLMVVNDNKKVSRLLSVGKQIEIVRAIQ